MFCSWPKLSPLNLCQFREKVQISGHLDTDISGLNGKTPCECSFFIELKLLICFLQALIHIKIELSLNLLEFC